MTDEFSAFQRLVEKDTIYYEKGKSRFFDKWRQDHLVLDKWFSALALSQRSDNLDKVIELSQLSEFTTSNPNRLRSLIGAFSQNHACFHTEDGRAYDWLADWVLQLDKQNPQLAARLVTPLTRWRRYDDVYKLPMQNALVKIQAQKALSSDVYELVSQSLKD